jgi:type II secretory ATPase GspE/PulE/Tfp pilus assembly ATPase PilB-like protein
MKPTSEAPVYEVDPSAAPLLPLDYCLEHGVVLLGSVPADPTAPVTVGMIAASDGTRIDELSQKLGHAVVPVILSASEHRRTLGRLYDLPLGETEGGLIALDADRAAGPARGRPAPELLESLLIEGISRRATDIHLETYGRGVEVRLRIDGVLHLLPLPLTHGSALRVISRLKVLCGVDLVEHRRSQDGRFGVLFIRNGTARRIDLRVTVLPGPHGQDVAIRVLDPDRFILDLSRLHMPTTILDSFRRLMRVPHGLLLATGPTGAGKTTTLYAALRELQDGALKIVSAEDPVEYEFPRVNQKNVTPEMGFADYLRAFLRSNPDVIHVGEIRDAETAEIAVRAGTTGHRVLGTLHTRDAVACVARLRALGVPDGFLSEVLLGVLGQRLVRRLCDDCKREGPAPAALVPLFFDGVPATPFWSALGCASCGGSGYRGLVGVFELFEPGETAAQAIAAGVPVEELRRIALAGGWVPLAEDALAKAARGLTSLEEVARVLPPKFRPQA